MTAPSLQLSEAQRADLLRQLREQHDLEQDRARKPEQPQGQQEVGDDETVESGAPTVAAEAPKKMMSPTPKYRVSPQKPDATTTLGGHAVSSPAADQKLQKQRFHSDGRPLAEKVGSMSILGGKLEFYARFTPKSWFDEQAKKSVDSAMPASAAPSEPMIQKTLSSAPTPVQAQSEVPPAAACGGNRLEEPQIPQSSAPQTPPQKELPGCITSHFWGNY